MQKEERQIFDRNLLLTQIYCAKQIENCDKNSASIFRSINPIINGKKLFDFKLTDYGFESQKRYSFSTEWSVDPYRDESTNWYKALFDLQLLEKQKVVKLLDDTKKIYGNILVVEIDNSVTDGASEVSSEGLIDIYDCPPIDTWFYFDNESKNRLLYAWIPLEFVYQANEAILVNCVDCIHWHEPLLTENENNKIQQANGSQEEVHRTIKLADEIKHRNQDETLFDRIRKLFK